jgi:hypothetical protein
MKEKQQRDARDMLDSSSDHSVDGKIEVDENSTVTVMLAKVVELLEQLDWKLWEIYSFQKSQRDEALLNSNSTGDNFESFFNEFKTILDDMKQKSEQDKESPVSKLFDK